MTMAGLLNSKYLQRVLAIISVGIISFCWLCWYNVSMVISASVASGTALVLFVLWFVEHRFYPIEDKRKGKSANFDWGMHYIRGFAILCIMVMHILTRFGMHPITRAFFSASTVYFLFISGYLCQYLALKKPIVDKEYYKKKIQNVILPYIIMSLVTLGLLCLLDQSRVGLPNPNSISWGKIPEMLILGKAQPQYWYIPFVVLLFIVSPKLSRISTKALVWLTIVSFVCAIVIPQRGGSKLAFSLPIILLKYTYFSFYYLVGFLYARLKGSIDPHIKFYAFPALLLGSLLGVGMLNPQLFGDAILKGGFACSFQKFLFLVPILVVAIGLRVKKIFILDALAEYSFALYFIHYFFVQDGVRIQKMIHVVCESMPNGLLTLIDVGLIVLFVFINLLWVIICKHALGRWSRSVLGV